MKNKTASVATDSPTAKVLSTLSILCIIVMILGGFAVTFAQVIGIAIDNPDLIIYAGTDLMNPVAIIAALAGVFSFLRLYTSEGRDDARKANIDTDEAGA